MCQFLRLETFCGVQGLYRVIDRECIVSFTEPQRHPFSVKMEAAFTSEGAGGGGSLTSQGSDRRRQSYQQNFFENRLYIVLVIVIFIVILIKE